jgi:hypothetical protein
MSGQATASNDERSPAKARLAGEQQRPGLCGSQPGNRRRPRTRDGVMRGGRGGGRDFDSWHSNRCQRGGRRSGRESAIACSALLLKLFPISSIYLQLANRPVQTYRTLSIRLSSDALEYRASYIRNIKSQKSPGVTLRPDAQLSLRKWVA